jgi:SnoaL-like domain
LGISRVCSGTGVRKRTAAGRQPAGRLLEFGSERKMNDGPADPTPLAATPAIEVRLRFSEALSFARSVYEAVDSMDETNLAEFLTEECRFTFGNAKPVVGRAAVAEASKAFISLIAEIKHEINDVWVVDDIIITRLNVIYTRKDKKTMSFPGVTIWRVEGKQISDYKIYIDNTPLFAS